MRRAVTTIVLACVLAGAASFAACSKTPELEARPGSSAPSTTGVAAPLPPGASTAMPANHPPIPSGTAAVAPAADPGPALAWDAPAAWKTAPNPNPMRKATYKIPKVAGDAEDAELAVSTAGGGVQPNIDRWTKQFGATKAKTDSRTVNGLKVTTVEVKGSFAAGGMMGAPDAPPKEKQMLLGAIVETGDALQFFKLVGPEKTVTAARADFDKFVGTFRPAK